MEKLRLTDLGYFETENPLDGGACPGHDQDWYRHWFRRLAGCGPTTAANILLYEMLAGSLGGGRGEPAPLGLREALEATFSVARPASLERLDRMWGFVTPSKRGGLNSTAKFCEGVRALAAAVGIKALAAALDVPKDSPERPPVEDVAAFIGEALGEDRPVAFLNLDNGAEKQLEKWHWVTVIGIDPEDEAGVMLDILDNCVYLRVNLNSWMATTAKGGGFVRFRFER
ncbi:MAG: hypothetical protein LBG71_01665 [Clostridiales Family XIII bacterium]|jgi:hypothetical protein|nr:hypothetical protein [Clostridiales Family XIII bacterium]